MSSVWQKLESTAGHPHYENTETGAECQEHPELAGLLESLQQYAGIKYAAYRAAFKTYELQKRVEVWSMRVSMGVLARHCLSISESSLTLEPCELEAVLADVSFACARAPAGTHARADTAPHLLLHLLLRMYHPERNAPIRVQSVKVLLIVLSGAECEEKWSALVETCADHNGCVSARRLAALLALLARAAEFLGEESLGQQHVQRDVDSCFAKSAGMLGMSTRAVVAWALSAEGSVHARWLLALDRVRAARHDSPSTAGRTVCSACGAALAHMLRFRCSKCCGAVVCETCYLYDKDLTTALPGHKKTHTLHEVVDGEQHSPECLGGFIKDFKRLFSCSKYCTKKKPLNRDPAGERKTDSCQVDSCKTSGKGTMFTSTVGRAAGGGGSNPQALLQDIISQLESQNRALKDLSGQLESCGGGDGGEGGKGAEERLRRKVDSHWGQIATQINRLKILKDNLTASSEPDAPTQTNTQDGDRLQAFDLFSPIPMLQEESQPKCDKPKSQPRVLSLDSGNFSDTSKPSHDSQQLMTVSGDAIKPIVVHATSDSISTVSMNDISTWFGNGTDTESIADRKRQSSANRKSQEGGGKVRSNSLCVTEQRYDADLQSVASSNHKMKELNADLDTVLDRLQQILTNNFVLDDSCFDNTQLRETANEMEGLLGTLIRGVEQRTTQQRTTQQRTTQQRTRQDNSSAV